MSKKALAKSIFLIIVGLILLVTAIFTTIYLCSDGRDYTEEYSVYKQVKDIKSLDDARSKLQTLKIEYQIKDKILSLNEFSHISFAINEDGSCLISSNKAMKNFEKLESEDLSTVTVFGISQDNKIVEKFTIYSIPWQYTKLNNHYFALLAGPFVLICTFIYFFGAITLFLGIANFIPAHSKEKQTT